MLLLSELVFFLFAGLLFAPGAGVSPLWGGAFSCKDSFARAILAVSSAGEGAFDVAPGGFSVHFLCNVDLICVNLALSQVDRCDFFSLVEGL